MPPTLQNEVKERRMSPSALVLATAMLGLVASIEQSDRRRQQIKRKPLDQLDAASAMDEMAGLTHTTAQQGKVTA